MPAPTRTATACALADGVLRQVHSQWVVKAGASGVPERVLGILMDDTEAWQMARSHAETTEQLGLALELANIVVFRHDLKTDRVGISDKAFELLGLPRPADDLSAEQLRALVHPEDQADLRASLETAVGHRPAGRPGDALSPRRRQLAPRAHAPHAAA